MSGVLRLLGVGVVPAYPGVAPPIIGVLSSHLLGVGAYPLLSGVSEKRDGVSPALRGVRSARRLGSLLRSCLTMGVVSHLVLLGVLSGNVEPALLF